MTSYNTISMLQTKRTETLKKTSKNKTKEEEEKEYRANLVKALRQMGIRAQ